MQTVYVSLFYRKTDILSICILAKKENAPAEQPKNKRVSMVVHGFVRQALHPSIASHEINARVK